MKKTMAKIIAAIAAAAMLAPMSSNALYRPETFDSFESSGMLEGFTEIGSSSLFMHSDKLYVSSDGSELIMFERLKNDALECRMSENADMKEISDLLNKKFGKLFISDYYETGVFSIDNLAPDNTKLKADICDFLKENGLITECKLITERYSVLEWYGRGINLYGWRYLPLDSNGEEMRDENDRIIVKDDAFEVLTEYAEKNLEGYTVGTKEFTGTFPESGKTYTDKFIELIPPEGTDITEQIRVAEKIQDKLHIYPSYECPESTKSVIAGEEIDVFNSVKGDANLDGQTTVADAVAILQFIGNRDKYELTKQGRLNADVDGVEGITPNDALTIQQWDAQGKL